MMPLFVLEHVMDPEEIRDALLGVLRDGGILLITVPKGREDSLSDEHVRWYDKERIEELFDNITYFKESDSHYFVEVTK
jgi:hypothetical protein